MSIPELLKWKVGYAADPAIEMLLDKGKIAEIKVKELDGTIRELEHNLEIVKTTRAAIAEQFKIR